MNLDFSAADEEFREEARTWLRENLPTEQRPPEGAAMREFDLAWQQTLHAGGWAGINWPVEYGGRGLSDIQQMIWYTEFAKADPPFTLNNSCTFVGNNHGGPTLMACGNDEQKSFHLPKILRGEVVWCQGFSEPGAGSDLASLSTKAVVDGDELVVTGQKIWTSYAEVADYQELLVRTNPDAPKHKGISWVICDMRSPGIEVRPIRLMGGDNHFSEVFYDEVRIPIENVVGGLNNGWKVAMATLDFERGTAFMADQLRLTKIAQDLVELAKAVPAPSGRGMAIDDGEIRAALARAVIGSRTLQSMTYQLVSRQIAGVSGAADSSLLRIQFSLVAQYIHRLAMRLRGADGLVDDSDLGERSWTYNYLWSFQTSIGGGTREIQRDIVGNRHLLLPR